MDAELMEYWSETLSYFFKTAGISVTEEQVTDLAKDCIVSAENWNDMENQARGDTSSPYQAELAATLQLLQEERSRTESVGRMEEEVSHLEMVNERLRMSYNSLRERYLDAQYEKIVL